ncbi:16S rRNA (cytosine(967)-C(5))-methyltransferase RsmB [Thermodesulfobacteriota bacterium]
MSRTTSQERGASTARKIALDALLDVRAGSHAEQALSSKLVYARSLSPPDRGLATELVYGVLRWQTRLDAVIGRCSHHPLNKIKRGVIDLLRMAVYQLLLLDRIPDHAAVDQSVAEARARFGKKTAGFVNALLRRVVRDGRKLDPRPGTDARSLSDYFSHPLWLVKSWLRQLGPDECRRVLELNNSRPPVVVRVNGIKTDAQRLRIDWEEEGLGATPLENMPHALQLAKIGRPVELLPGFDEGLFVVQDCASQMVAPLLGIEPGDRVLDACAAPGGKTAHLAALASNDARIIAVDKDPVRLEETRINLSRLGVTCVELECADSSEANILNRLGLFDRVLVDPPCSGLGVLRHNPETKYKIRPTDPARFAEQQSKLLTATSESLAPGGTLVYSVCTVTEEETTGVVNRFLRENKDFELVPLNPTEAVSGSFVRNPGILTTFPSPTEYSLDGFFAAKMRRKSRGT